MTLRSPTAKQRAVAELVSRGLSHKEIARRLGISHGAVRHRMSYLCRRLGTPTRAEMTLRHVAELRSPPRQQIAVAGSPLTAIELAILGRIAEGAALGEIALERHRAEQTVKIEAAKARDRLGARTNAHAVYLACKQGLLT